MGAAMTPLETRLIAFQRNPTDASVLAALTAALTSKENTPLALSLCL